MNGIRVDPEDPAALHQQVAGEISRAIAEGQAGPGERLPPARDLAAVLGVNADTVLRAVRELGEEGLLEVWRGRGITVAGPAPGRSVIAGQARELVRLFAAPRIPPGRAGTDHRGTAVTPGPLTVCEPRPGAGSCGHGAEALIAEARQRQRRRWRRRGLVVAVLALLAAAAVTGGPGLSGGTARSPSGGAAPAPPAPAAAMPSQIVVLTASSKIEVVSSRTGLLIRTLATNVALFSGSPALAVSPAGVVYFDDVYAPGPLPTVPGGVQGSGRGAGEWVLSVPLAGGPVTHVALGSDLALSPDGRLLAYVPWTDPRCPAGAMGCPGKPAAIVVRDLPAGTQKTWAFTSTESLITNLSWSPDGRYLAFAGMTGTKNGTVWVRTAQVLDTRSGGTLDGARPIPLGQAAAWAGYLTSHTGVAVLTGPDGVIQASGGLVEVGAGSGRVLRRLTSLPPRGLGTGNVFDGTEHTITADRSGRYLLIAGLGAGTRTGTGETFTGEIFRWTFGLPHPVGVISGAIAAAWAG